MTQADSYQMTSGGGNARSLGEILKAFCPACTSMSDPCLGLRRRNGRSGMGGETSQSPGSPAAWAADGGDEAPHRRRPRALASAWRFPRC